MDALSESMKPSQCLCVLKVDQILTMDGSHIWRTFLRMGLKSLLELVNRLVRDNGGFFDGALFRINFLCNLQNWGLIRKVWSKAKRRYAAF